MSLEGLRVAAVFGSISPEHEISVITACQAMPVLSELGAEVVPIYISKRGRWLTHPSFSELATFRGRLPEDGDPVLLDLAAGTLRIGGGSRLSRPRELPVDVLLPLTHGPHGEDGTLAALADVARLPQAGSGPLAASLAMDKFRSRQLLRAEGLPVVPARLARSRAGVEEAARELSLPVVVKPNCGGSSIGVSVASSAAELAAAAELAFEFDRELVVEAAVVGAEDLNCAVKAASPRVSEVERPLKGGELLSYSDKYASKGALTEKGMAPAKGDPRRELPARIPGELRARVQELAVAAFDALGCAGTARVDFLLGEGGEVYLNEVNTIPGSMAFYLWEASGVGYPELLQELILEALERRPAPRQALADNLLAAGSLLGK